jgi:hypothetical protein
MVWRKNNPKARRKNFTWILDLRKGKDEKEKEDGPLWDVEVHLQNGLAFKVQVASHETSKAEYEQKVKEFFENSRAVSTVAELDINDPLPTASLSQPLTPGGSRILISEDLLGQGSFGEVDRVVNVNTDTIYARKTFLKTQEGRTEEWLEGIHREISIMKSHPHVRMARVFLG